MVNKKKRCSECNRLLRVRNFVFNPIRKERICRSCSRRIGTNIFYEPDLKKKNKDKRYSKNLDWTEKKYLFRQKVKEGISEEKTKEQIENIVNVCKKIRLELLKEEKEKKEMQKRFLEGLKEVTDK